MFFDLIINDGAFPYELLSLVGASMTRDSKGTIGQFGSGLKYSIALLMRKKLSPFIYSAGQVINFSTEQVTITDGVETKIFNRIIAMKNNDMLKLGVSIEYGEKDWQDITHAYRELVSNSLDMQYRLKDNYHIRLIPKVSENHVHQYIKPDNTVIAIPSTPEGVEYLANIGDTFLHFSPHMDERIFNSNGNIAKVYLKNVLCYRGTKPSVFHYNLTNAKLNESRVMSEDMAISCLYDIPDKFTPEQWKKLFLAFQNTDETQYFEQKLSFYYVNQEHCKKGFELAFGEKAVLCTKEFEESVRAKGFTPVVLKSSLYSKFSDYLPTYSKVLSFADLINKSKSTESETLVSLFESIWTYLQVHNLTGYAEKPRIELINYTNVSATTFGHYKDGVVYISDGINCRCDEAIATIIEEFGHHITKAADGTRMMSEWMLKVILSNIKEKV